MSKHTPAPWIENQECRFADIGSDPNRLCIEISHNGYAIGYWVPTEWDGMCPDSKLIAVAPELLRTIKNLLSQIRDTCKTRKFTDGPLCVAAEATHAVIRKAEGRGT